MQEFEFSEEAQRIAREVLGSEDRTPQTFFRHLQPLFEADDIRNAFLVSAAFFLKGSLTEVIRFARDQRNSKTYGPMLDWLKQTLADVGAIPRREVYDIRLSADVWVRLNSDG